MHVRDIWAIIATMTAAGDGGASGGSGGAGGSGSGSGDGGQGGSGGAGGSGSGSGDGQGGSAGGAGGQSGNQGGQGGAGGSGGQGNQGGAGGSGGQSGNGQGGNGRRRALEDMEPDELRAYVRELRGESRDHRQGREQAEGQLTEFQRRVARDILGIDPDGDDARSPERLTAQLTATRTEVADVRRENLLLRVAGEAGGDPARLADSRSFMDSISGIDPTAQDARTAMVDKIKTAVQNDAGLASRTAAQNNGGGNRIGGGRVPAGGGTPTGVRAGRELRRARSGAGQGAQNGTTNQN